MRTVSRLLAAAAVSVSVLVPSVGQPAVGAPSPIPVDYTGRFAVSVLGDGAFGGERVYASHFDDGNASLALASSRRAITLRLNGGDLPGGARADLSFSAPENGGPLAVGSYVGGTNSPLDVSRPQIDFAYRSSGWDTAGSFDILDLHLADGQIDRIRLTYVVYLDGDPRPVSGTVSLGYDNHRVQASPSAVRWPDTTYPGHESTPVRVELRRLTSEHVRASGEVLQGPDRDEFALSYSWRGLLPTGDGLPLTVVFSPVRPGPAHAWLRINLREYGVPSHLVVPLDAVAPSGSTRWDMQSDAGDEVGQGAVYHLTDTTRLWFEGSPDGFDVRSTQRNPVFRAWVEPPAGQQLHVGTYRQIAVAATADQPRFDLTSDTACETVTGHFDIDDLAYSDTDQTLTRLDLTFVQHCDGGPSAIRGRIRLHVADDHHVPPPAAVTASRDGDRVVVRWKLPAAADVAGVAVRSYTGVRAFPAGPAFGEFRSTGIRSITSFGAPHDEPVGLSLFAYDRSGNVSTPVTLTVRPSPAPPLRRT